MRKEHILVIRFSALGDVAMAVPVVWALANQYPDIRITVLSRGMVRPLFDDLAPNVKQFTKVADLHNVLRSDYLRMRFNLGRYRVEHIDKHRRMRRKLISFKHKVREQLPTSFENYAEVFARLGYPVDVSQFHSIFPPKGGNLNMLPAIFGPKRSFQKWIGIAPFAAHAGKIYPPQLMEQQVPVMRECRPAL